jgi:cell wall-associated NlpC family hydrolase
LLSLRSRARILVPALAVAFLIGIAPPAPAAATSPTTEAQQIIRIARAQIGDPWRMAATGPSSFDCSGLVIYAYRSAGAGAVIRDGRLRSAKQLLQSFRARGLASRSNPKLGDLVVWGGGKHIGIYIGNGNAISTLSTVRVHRVSAVTMPFTAYLHTGMSVKYDKVQAARIAKAAKPPVVKSALRQGYARP